MAEYSKDLLARQALRLAAPKWTWALVVSSPNSEIGNRQGSLPLSIPFPSWGT
jgi:hypothetical protein